MAQRVEPSDSLDFFPTPPWATRALCEWLYHNQGPLHTKSVWEPCCGAGDMAKPLSEYFGPVMASDIEDRGYGVAGDFFDMDKSVDWIISNPPFNRAEEFVQKAIDNAKVGVAVFARLSFLETVGRYHRLFSPTPPSFVLPFTERVPIHKGKLTKTGSTATAYCWLVWLKDEQEADTRLRWIAPCRSSLEKEEDYTNG